MKSLITLFLAIILIPSFSQDVEGLSSRKIQTIAFGSCSKQDQPDKQLWKEIDGQNPDLWIWLGDNIYGDSEDMGVIKEKYEMQKSHPDYQTMAQETEIIGIWDDHDFGVNDGGKEYPKKEQTRDLLFDFVDLGENHAAWKRKGAYQAHTYDFDNNRLKVILLDARYFRDPLKKNKDNNNVPDFEGEILGDEQWNWLNIQLDDQEADLFIIGSGIQVLAKDHRFEKWANFPNERNRLLSLIREKVKVPVVFISGDRHISEVSKIEIEDFDYTIYDVTSSSLTHGWSERRPEKNELRIGEIVYDPNYALFNIKWKGKTPSIQLEYYGKSNELLQEFSLKF